MFKAYEPCNSKRDDGESFNLIWFLATLFISFSLQGGLYVKNLKRSLIKAQQEVDLFKEKQESLKIKSEYVQSLMTRRTQQADKLDILSAENLGKLYLLLDLPPHALLFGEEKPLDYILFLQTLKSNLRYMEEKKLPLKIAASKSAEELGLLDAEMKMLDEKIKELEESAKELGASLNQEIETQKKVDQSLKLTLKEGVLRRPVQGILLPKSEEKIYSRGLRFSSKKGETVSAPIDGKVSFSGHYRSFGNVVIMEIWPRLHMVFAGLGKVNANVGEKIKAGKPLGTMPTEDGNDQPVLYLEIRFDSQPVFPEIEFLD